MAEKKRGYSVTYDDTEFPKTFRLQAPQGTHLAEVTYDAQEDALLLHAQPGVHASLVYHLIEHALSITPAEYTYGDKHVFKFYSHNELIGQGVIQDLVFAHIKSTLDWIPTWTSQSSKKPNLGIPYFGPCQIREDGLEKFSQILTSWKTIFEQGPEPLAFCSGYNVNQDFDEDEPEKSYWSGALPKMVRVSKQATLQNLNQLIEFIHKTISSNGYIEYIGIREGEPDMW